MLYFVLLILIYKKEIKVNKKKRTFLKLHILVFKSLELVRF